MEPNSLKKCGKCGEIGGKDGCGFYKSRISGVLRYRCKKCESLQSKGYRIGRGDVLRKRRLELYQQNIHSKRKIQTAWRNKNKKTINTADRLNREIISDSYVKHVITSNSGLKRPEVTPEMISFKRESIVIYRQIKTQREKLKCLKSQTNSVV